MASVALEHGQRIAVIVTGILASISTLSVTLLLLHIFSVAIFPLLGRSTSHSEHTQEERIFLRTHLGVFVVCLLCSDLVQGISGYFQFVWAAHGHVFEGGMCTTQAAMLLFGDNGTAIWAAVISFHTVLTVVGRKRIPGGVVIGTVVGGWTLAAILTFIGPLAIETRAQGPFYGIAGAWCFVTSKYEVARVIVHYLPLLVSACLITVNYALVALVLSGVLVCQGRTWKFVAPYRRQEQDSSYRWHKPKLSFSRLQRNPSSASTSGPAPGAQTIEKDGGVGKTPYRPGTSQSNYSVVTKGNPQDLESNIGGNHKPTPAAPTTPTEPLQRRPTIPKSQAQFKSLALKMLWYPIVYIALVLPIACGRLDFKHPPSLSIMLAFMCLLWLMGTANSIVYVTTRRIGGSPVLRNRSLKRERRKASQEDTDQSHSIQVLVDRYTKVDHVVSLASSPSDGGSPQVQCFDPSEVSPTFPARTFHPSIGATNSDLEAQRRWAPEPPVDEEDVVQLDVVQIGKTEKVGVAM